jgi:hypothetical protein
VKTSTSFYLLAALIFAPSLAAPAFAEDGKDFPGWPPPDQTVKSAGPTTPVLAPYPRQWWKDN